MKRFLITTSNAQELKELDAQARMEGSRAVALSGSGSLYIWDGKVVKANPDDVAVLLNLPVEEILRWIESKGKYAFKEEETIETTQEEVKTVEESEDSIEETESQDNASVSFLEVKEDYVEAVHDEKVYEALVEIGELLRASDQRLEEILKVLQANILE